ncbi:MAG: hypothetical protein CFK52_14115, partial [Chloracidobacterium sp. CP2_5A]
MEIVIAVIALAVGAALGVGGLLWYQNTQGKNRRMLAEEEARLLLARAHDEQAAAQALAEKTIDALLADRVEVSIPSASLARGMTFNRKPDVIAPLQAARGLLGEIRVWRLRPAI